MGDQLIRVGAREFREALAEYLDSPGPLAITRHGRTVGYYIPAHGNIDEQELTALKEALARLRALLTEYGIGEDDVVGDFRALRHRA